MPAACGKYLSRVFGIFSEQIVRFWASDSRSPYEDLGRPTLRKPGETTGYTLDFTLRRKDTGKIYVAEQKCEIEFQNYKYFILTDVKQLEHHSKDAFLAFLEVASGNENQRTFVGREELQTNGAILIWGAATPEGKRAVKNAKGFFDILTIEDMVRDLISWDNKPYREFMEQRRAWANEMFDGLLQSQSA